VDDGYQQRLHHPAPGHHGQRPEQRLRATPTAPTVTYSGFVNGDTGRRSDRPADRSSAATASSHVGTYAVTASGAVDPNYSISYVVGTATVTTAPLTITADDQTKGLWRPPLPSLTASYSNFVNGDTAASLTTPATLTTTATAASGVAGNPYGRRGGPRLHHQL